MRAQTDVSGHGMHSGRYTGVQSLEEELLVGLEAPILVDHLVVILKKKPISTRIMEYVPGTKIIFPLLCQL